MSTIETVDEVATPTPPKAAGSQRLPVSGRWILVGLALLGGLGLQTQLYPSQERLVSTVLMFVALATAWNLIGGFTGYACFGQVGFFGVGGYATALIMTHLQLSFWLALPVAGVAAALVAVLVGTPLLRLKGHYFAVATLGVAEGLREVVINMPKVTGGGGGITIPTFGDGAPTRWLGNDGFYLLFLFIAVAAVAVAMLVSRSRGGYALRAIHQDEDAAAAMGINTTRAKIWAFTGSAFITGVVGAAHAFQLQTIYPNPEFDVAITVMMVVMVVLGGSGTVTGPIIGAIAVAYLSEWLRSNYTDVHTFMLGALIVVAVILLPQGFSNYLSEAIRLRRFSLLENVRRYRL